MKRSMVIGLLAVLLVPALVGRGDFRRGGVLPEEAHAGRGPGRREDGSPRRGVPRPSGPRDDERARAETRARASGGSTTSSWPRARRTRTSTPTAAKTASGSDPRAVSSRSSSRRAPPSTSTIGSRRRPSTPSPTPSWSRPSERVSFRKKMSLTNYSGTAFDVELRRVVRLLPEADAWARVGQAPTTGVRVVAFESDNRITNAGASAWRKETGLVSVWILGMFQPSPTTTVVVPFKAGHGRGARAEGERRLLRPGPGQSARRRGRRPVLPGRRPLPQQDRHLPRAGEVGARQLRREGRRAHDRRSSTARKAPPTTSTRCGRSRTEPYGGDAVNSYNDGAARARPEAARPLLRARDLVAGRGLEAGRDPRPHPPHHALRRGHGRPRQDRKEGPGHEPRRDHRGIRQRTSAVLGPRGVG